MILPKNFSAHPTQRADFGRHDRSSSAPKKRREIDVSTLFEEAREVALLHRGEIYSLRITANGKLILTK